MVHAAGGRRESARAGNSEGTAKVQEPAAGNARARLFPSPGLGARGQKEPQDHAVQLVEAPDYQAEVDAVARWIRMLVAGGMRYRDIVVLMRSEQDYQHFLEASFHEHNIPFFVDRRRSASHHPLLRLIRAALAVATSRLVARVDDGRYQNRAGWID